MALKFTDHNPRNDIQDFTDPKVFDRLDLDLDSPRLKKAMEKFSVIPSDLKKK